MTRTQLPGADWQRVGMTREDAERTVDLARFIQEGVDRRRLPAERPKSPKDESP